MNSPTLRVRLYSSRDAYERLVWAYEVYNPVGRLNMQVRIGGGWYPSWDAACQRGLAALRNQRSRSDGQPVHPEAR